LDLRGRVIAQLRLPHRDADARATLRRAANGLNALLTENGAGRTPLGLGVASGGWVDRDSGVIVDHAMLGWRRVPVSELLENYTGLAVRVDAHSRALLHAERLFGHALSRRSVASLFIGNVVDAAFAIADRVQHGPRSQAGVIAHLPVAGSVTLCSCGRAGCLQATVSERTLLRRAVAEGVIGSPVLSLLLAAAQDGNVTAMGLFVERARHVGRAAALLTDLLNPDLVVVAEPGIAVFPECLAALRSEVRQGSSTSRELEDSVVATSFPGRVTATAAGAVILHELYQDPTDFRGGWAHRDVANSR
jgi:predicted NBD/HSP70 family sugar kinase